MKTTRTIFDRNSHKTNEGEFIYELEHSYELSPKLSEQILHTAQSCLSNSSTFQSGKILYHATSLEEKSGKSLQDLSRTKVSLTLHSFPEDLETLQEFDKSHLRRIKILRLTDEAIEQGGLLSQEDLCILLGSGLRTIKRDISILKAQGFNVITRGVYHSIGRCQTHKALIINMYLEGYTYSEIKLRSRHSVGAIKRYLDTFGKVLMCLKHNITEVPEIQSVIGLSRYLIGQYTEIISSAENDKVKKETLQHLENQLSYQFGLKKTIMNDGLRAEVMIGGNK